MRQAEADLTRIREYIGQQQFAEQERLPPERELAVILGLTRNRLRSGLKKLAAEGLVWRHVGKGTFYGRRLFPAATHLQISPLADLTNPREVMEARLSIEPELAKLAAYRAKGSDFTEIDNCMQKMDAIDNWDAFEVWDCRLHRAIAHAAGNALMLVIFDVMQANRNRDLFGRLRQPIEPTRTIKRVIQEHTEVFDALRHRDPERAAESMRQHLRAVRRSLFGEN